MDKDGLRPKTTKAKGLPFGFLMDRHGKRIEPSILRRLES
jgi:hypothetical protein